MLEDNFGMDCQFWKAHLIPIELTPTQERIFIKDNEVSEVKRIIFSGLHEIDDPIDIYSKHTMLHDAVMMNRIDIFYFLI